VRLNSGAFYRNTDHRIVDAVAIPATMVPLLGEAGMGKHLGMDPDPLLTFPKWVQQGAPRCCWPPGRVHGLIGLLCLRGQSHDAERRLCPVQPVPYSHALHVGKLGLDCRYCHTTVEQTAMAHCRRPTCA